MIGLRYLRARQSTRFASFISLASLVGVALGVMALITILSVMNGFEAELRSRLLNMQSHAVVDATTGPLADWPDLREQLLDIEGVEDVTPAVDIEGMASVEGNLVPLLVQGIDPALEQVESGIAGTVVTGTLKNLEPGSRAVAIGRYLSFDLALQPGDSMQFLVPQPTENGLVPRLQTLRIAAIFDSGVPEYDSGVAYMHWQDAAAIKGLAGRVTGLKARFDDALAAPQRSAAIERALPQQFNVVDWTQQNASYFRAIRIEKTMMALILSLVIAVAAFNIIASLVMVVTDKQTDIAILRTMGLSQRGVVRVFFTQGMIIAWGGVIAGVIGGVLLAANVTEVVSTLEQALGFQLMPGDVYVMSAIPSEIRWPQVFTIAAAALIITSAATLYPSRKAASVHPAEALRYG
ncbi:MAG: lipoprotein-releasing ABC transporter permease subunit [Pseudomonadota bacterium]